MSQKMKWTKPQLIVLARGTPEEAVLLVCKNNEHESGQLSTGAEVVAQLLCNRTKTQGNPCGACSGVTGT